MSDALTAALARIAALEAEVSRSRKPEHNSFTPEVVRDALTRDPIGTLTRLGVPVDFVTKVAVAHALGDQAPPELKALAAMGPQVSHAQALDSKVETLSRQISSMTEAEKKKARANEFKALTADKTKYPSLAKALQEDPTLLDDEMDSMGESAEEFASKLEARLSKVAKVFAPPPASEESADPADAPQGDPAHQADPSPKVKPATTSGNVPALPQSTPGVFTEAEHAKLRDEMIRKYTSGEKTP